jgi:hypothetical protein
MVEPAAPTPTLIEPKADHTKAAKTFLLVIFILGTIIGISLSVYFYVRMSKSENNVAGQINTAVAAAVAQKGEEDNTACEKRLKETKTYFTGPSDYGTLAFEVPKVWSVYIAKDAEKGGNFEAYFNPNSVQAVNNTNLYYLRLTISTTSYETVVKTYDSAVKSNKMSLSTIQVNKGNNTAAMYKGTLPNNAKASGYVTIIKIRDKTAILQTDSLDFYEDYKAILDSITFNE